MLEIFFEKKVFFQLKELEKIAPKEKGITSMSVKDVLQGLVDDALVDTDRVGTSNYFWAFPSKVANNRKRRLDELKGKLVQSQQKRAALGDEVATAKALRTTSDGREELLKELEKKKALHQKLSAELERYKSCDPERVEELRQQAKVAVDAANRWTDNIFSIKSWCKQRFSFEESTLDKQFGIPEDLDYMD